MKPLVLLSANTLSLVATLAINYTAGTGVLTDQSIGEVSSRYPTLLTPAGYAFSIWGLIYLMLLAFVGFQWVGWFKNRNEESLKPAGAWFLVANTFNALWVFAWIHEALGWSVLLMFVLLFSLTRLVVRLRLEVRDAPLRIIFVVWWPVCIYIGWIISATVSNVSAYLKTFGFLREFLAPEVWAVLVLTFAAMVYLLLIIFRNMREAALVGVWAFVAIACKQWGSHDSVVISALLLAVVLFLSAGYHALKNKDSSPFAKLQRGEW